MTSKRTILIIEDEPHIALGLEDALSFEGYRVVSTGTGREGCDAALREHPDAVLLDLMLPDMNGYDVCASLRVHDPLIPIVMLTARGTEADKIRGLNAGADDYVTKPFSVAELLARIRAIFRRLDRASTAEDAILAIGEATIDLAGHRIARSGQTPEALSFYEVELLRLLYERSGKPVSRDEIMTRVWGVQANATSRTIDNFIVKLRKKIERHPNKPKHILTVYGHGYKLVI